MDGRLVRVARHKEMYFVLSNCQGMTAEAYASSCSAATSWADCTNARTAQKTMENLSRGVQAFATSDAETSDRARNCFSSGKSPTSSH